MKRFLKVLSLTMGTVAMEFRLTINGGIDCLGFAGPGAYRHGRLPLLRSLLLLIALPSCPSRSRG